MKEPERTTIENAYDDLRKIKDRLTNEDFSGAKTGIENVLINLQLALEYEEDYLKGNYNH